jgi:hypothetical protein
MSPRCSHYESLNIARFIGACLAYGPTLVIIQFPDYFDPILITVVAFILALVHALFLSLNPRDYALTTAKWQLCLGEWVNGYFESKELGSLHMLNRYEAHLASLKQLWAVAPGRFLKLQDEWT